MREPDIYAQRDDRYSPILLASMSIGCACGGTMKQHASDWAEAGTILAYGLLVCVAAICAAYFVLRAWPRHHYPRLFATLAGAGTITGMYVLEVPGSGFALVALGFCAFIGLYGIDALFEEPPSRPPPVPASNPVLWSFALGTFIALVASLVIASVLLVPPGHIKQWVFHPEPLNARIERALEPGGNSRRQALETLKKEQAELSAAHKRIAELETALSKAQDELGVATSNTVRGVVIKSRSGSRHANGAVYIGVDLPVTSGNFCAMFASSDKVDSIKKNLHLGEAVSIPTSRGKYRVVLTSLDSSNCVFDLVKD